MDSRNRKYSAIGVIALSVIVLALYIHRHRQGQTGKIDNFLIGTSGYIQKQFYYFTRGTQSLFDNYFLLVGAKQQKAVLEKERDYLKTKLTAMKELELENLRLRSALDFGDRISHELLSANVVAHDVSSDYFGIRIDKGIDQGVKIGMGVISPGGLVGRVQRVSSNFSDVMTVVDPRSKIDALVQRSRAGGIVTGQSKRLTCRLEYVDKVEDVAVNDTIVSSGFADIFPKGLLIGHVTEVIPDPNGILQEVVVKSAVNIYRLEEVFVVVSQKTPPS